MKPGRPARDDAVELPAYLHAIRRGLAAVVVCALVGAIGGTLWILRTPRVYSSTSAVLVAEAPLYLTRQGEESAKRFTIDTEAIRLASAPVLAATRAATGEEDLKNHVHLSAIPTTKVLKVTYRSTDRQAAERGAAAMTTTYLRLRREEFEGRRDQRVALVARQLATLNARLDRTATGGSSSADLTARRAGRQAVADQIAVRQAESREVRTSSTYPGQVLQVGGTTTSQRLNPLVPPVAGLVLGGLIGLLVAAARSSRLGRAVDISRLVPGRSVVTLPQRWIGRPGSPSWEPITTGVLALGSGTIVLSPPDRDPGVAEQSAADQLAAALRSRGRPPGRAVRVVTGGALSDEPGSVLAARTGHVVLVVTPQTRRRALLSAVRRATDVGATVHGIVVLTRFALSRRSLR